MADDILQAAQDKINEAAKQTDPFLPAQAGLSAQAGQGSSTSASAPPLPPEPVPEPLLPPAEPPMVAPVVSSEPIVTEHLVKDTNPVVSDAITPSSPFATSAVGDIPSTPPPIGSTPSHPSPFDKKKKSGKGMLIVTLLLLLLTLPVLGFYVAKQKNITLLPSRANLSCPTDEGGCNSTPGCQSNYTTTTHKCSDYSANNAASCPSDHCEKTQERITHQCDTIHTSNCDGHSSCTKSTTGNCTGGSSCTGVPQNSCGTTSRTINCDWETSTNCSGQWVEVAGVSCTGNDWSTREFISCTGSPNPPAQPACSDVAYQQCFDVSCGEEGFLSANGTCPSERPNCCKPNPNPTATPSLPPVATNKCDTENSAKCVDSTMICKLGGANVSNEVWPCDPGKKCVNEAATCAAPTAPATVPTIPPCPHDIGDNCADNVDHVCTNTCSQCQYGFIDDGQYFVCNSATTFNACTAEQSKNGTCSDGIRTDIKSYANWTCGTVCKDPDGCSSCPGHPTCAVSGNISKDQDCGGSSFGGANCAGKATISGGTVTPIGTTTLVHHYCGNAFDMTSGCPPVSGWTPPEGQTYRSDSNPTFSSTFCGTQQIDAGSGCFFSQQSDSSCAPASTATPTTGIALPSPTSGGPPPAVCETIRIYDAAGNNITEDVRSKTRALALGETITMATTKGGATQAHFRIQGITDWTVNDPTLTTDTEYRRAVQIPTNMTQTTGFFEVEVYVDGQWK